MSWRKVKLGALVDNFSVRAKDVGGAEGLDFFGVSNEEGIIKTKYAAEDKAEDYKIIEKGCFAYNPYRVNVGSIGLVSDETRGLISPAYVIFKPKPKSIIPELLFKFLKSDEGLRQIIFYARGTVRQALRFEDLCKIEISIPDFSEQEVLFNKLINSQKSSNILDSELKNQLNLLKKLRQQLLQDAVQGKLVEQNKKDEPANELLKKIKKQKAKLIAEKKLKKEKELPPIKHEEIPFEIPENWVWCRLGEIGKITGGGTPSMGNYEYWNGDIPWVSPKDMWTEFVSDTEMKVTPKGIKESSTNLIPVGSLLIVGRSGILKRKLPVAINSVECTVNQDMKVIIPHIIKMNRFLQFMFWGLESNILKEYVKFGMTVHSLKYDEFSQMPIPLPPIKEQERIVQKVEELMQYCNELEASIKQSESQNEKLLQQVLREALRPKTIELNQENLAIAAEPQTEYKKGKIIELKPSNIDYYRRSVLAAEIVWQLHKEPTLGHLKLQKLIYLCQKTANMQLPTNFLRQAMGPYDNRLMRSIDKQLMEKKWFKYQKDNVFKYQPLEKAGQHHNDFIKYFSSESHSIQFMIDKFKSIKSDIIEIVATLFGCLDNMLNEQLIFSEGLLLQRFYEWSDEKKKFSEKEVKRVFVRMKETGIIPKGYNF